MGKVRRVKTSGGVEHVLHRGPSPASSRAIVLAKQLFPHPRLSLVVELNRSAVDCR